MLGVVLVLDVDPLACKQGGHDLGRFNSLLSIAGFCFDGSKTKPVSGIYSTLCDPRLLW